jgi:uncharacterized protein YcfJ
MKKILLLCPLLLVGCSFAPTGPTVAVMPAAGKPFDLFQKEDYECRQFASNSVADASQQSMQEGITSAAIGSAIGAAAGALINGGSHQGVGTGAGIGLVGGSAIGAANAHGKQNTIQVQYNNAYMQCMYAKGNQVPAFR